jgi:hypothetical protein
VPCPKPLNPALFTLNYALCAWSRQALALAQKAEDKNKQLMVCLEHGMLKDARRLIDA